MAASLISDKLLKNKDLGLFIATDRIIKKFTAVLETNKEIYINIFRKID